METRLTNKTYIDNMQYQLDPVVSGYEKVLDSKVIYVLSPISYSSYSSSINGLKFYFLCFL